MKKLNNAKEIINSLITFAKMICQIDSKRILITTVVFILLPVSDIAFSVWLLNYIIKGYDNGIEMHSFVIVMAVLLVFQILVWSIESYYFQLYSHNSNLKISSAIHKMLYKKVEEINLIDLENQQFYKKYYFVLNDFESRISEFIELIEKSISSIVMILTLSTIIVFTDPILFIIILFPIFYEISVSPKLSKIKYEFDKERKEQERNGEYAQRVMYMKDYSKEIRTTKILNVILQQYNTYINKSIELIQKYGLKVGFRNTIITYSYQILSFFATILYISHSVLTNDMEISNGIIIISTYNQIVYSFKNIVDIYSDSLKQALYIKNMLSFLNKKDLRSKNYEYIEIPKSIDTMEFANVSFQYSNDKYALKNINFTVKKGEKVAVIGNNGAGKTTLVKLILRLYEPSEGKIFLNGIDIKHFDINQYRKITATILQNFKIFATDLEKNILNKSIENEMDKAVFDDAILKSGFGEKFKKLNNNSKTIITKEFDSNGEILSGGEMQKLAIARAIAQPSDILIMDEPTSALDPIAEYNFYNTISNNFNDKIVIFISHNYSASVFADKIIYFENAQILESGTHESLLKLNGKYAKLFKMQASNFACESNGGI